MSDTTEDRYAIAHHTPATRGAGEGNQYVVVTIREPSGAATTLALTQHEFARAKARALRTQNPRPQ